MKHSGRQPERLIVCECCGDNPPRGDPCDCSFLGIWPEPPYYYLFFAHEPGAGFFLWLGRQEGWVLRDTYHLAYEEWQQVGEGRVRVGPFSIETIPSVSAHLRTEAAKGMVLRIDPGLVFGSGLHGSTRGCLLAIADLHGQFMGKTVVDMGTGTGILAISCGTLGAARVLGIDKNPLAIRTAARNVSLNRLQERVKLLVAGDLGVLKRPSELLIMNLEPPILAQLLAGRNWLAYPRVILSGFLETQWNNVRINIPSAFRIRRWETVEGWLTVTLSE